MATALAGVHLSFASAAAPEGPMRQQGSGRGALVRLVPSRRLSGVGVVRSGPSTPPGISEKVSESIKKAEELCAGDEVTGECAAAWDEVEELSAAASHAREKLKAHSDPLEIYCKDNPETDQCRTYED